MKLTVFSHKPCWPSATSPTGYATDGGFPMQMGALSELFDETRLLLPFNRSGETQGEIPLAGNNLKVVRLTARRGSGIRSKLGFLPWSARNAPAIVRELLKADAIHVPIPGDVGTVGMLGAFLLRKPLFVRHCGNWLKPATMAEKFWRWFMETTAGSRNVMLATGGTGQAPSSRNPNVRWIFSTSLTEEELKSYACPRSYPLPCQVGRVTPCAPPPVMSESGAHGVPRPTTTPGWLEPTANRSKSSNCLPSGEEGDQVRLIIVARQEKAKGAGTIIQALPLLNRQFPGKSFDIVGQGSSIPEFKQLAAETGVEKRVHFWGKLNHEQVMQRLRDAHLFIFPTTSSDGFPKAVLEALASGLPVVATRVSVLPQLLGNDSGVLISEATPEAVARGVEYALSDPVRYEAMSRKAIETARQYSLEAWRDEIGAQLRKAWGDLKTKESREQKAESGNQSAAGSGQSSVVP